MSKLEKYAIFGAALFGIATILLGVNMLFIFPSTAELSQGFRTPINSFEFARTDADLAFLSGSGERRSRPRSNLQTVGLLSLVWVAPCLRAATAGRVLASIRDRSCATTPP